MPAQYPAALHRLGKVVLVVNEMISRSLNCVCAEVQCRGSVLCEVDALAGQQKALTKESKTYAQTVFETKSGG